MRYYQLLNKAEDFQLPTDYITPSMQKQKNHP